MSSATTAVELVSPRNPTVRTLSEDSNRIPADGTLKIFGNRSTGRLPERAVEVEEGVCCIELPESATVGAEFSTDATLDLAGEGLVAAASLVIGAG